MAKRNAENLSESKQHPQISPKSTPSPFLSDDSMIESARQMFACRHDKDAHGIPDKELARQWHQCVSLTRSDSVKLAALMHRYHLSRDEREILMALVLSRLGLATERLNNCKEIMAYLKVPPEKVMKALRALSEEGRLYRTRLISYDDIGEELGFRQIVLIHEIVSTLISPPAAKKPGKKDKGNCIKLLLALRRAMDCRARLLQYPHTEGRKRVAGFNSNIRRLFDSVRSAAVEFPSWKLNDLLDERYRLCEEEQLILLYLAGWEQDCLGEENDIPTGATLARACAYTNDDAMVNLKYLKPSGKLVEYNLVQPCCGAEQLLSSDDRNIANAQFELTESALATLGIPKSISRQKASRSGLRDAKISMDQLVLSDSVRRMIDMAVAQASHSETMLRDWGLGDIISYGRGVTVLFSGPPGTGKTACAEAIAHRLSSPILIADYSKIIDCYVGKTEKNIASAFRDAQANKAVLFWDEADAMFYDRSMAKHTWEIQNANVILSELERFDGVCILATNRKISLDPALERRISLKINFERPDQVMRRKIWQCLVPPQLPIGKEVNLDRLSMAELSGGEIKNVVLNAVRLALARNAEKKVTSKDFEEAIQMEISGRWQEQDRKRIGFCI